MSSSILSEVERVLQENSQLWLSNLQGRWSCLVTIFRTVQNDFSTVYGRESGEENVNESTQLEAIVVGDDFFPVDVSSGGTWKEGWLYSDSDKFAVGDRIEIHRDDFRGRKYELISIHGVGTTRKVFKKYKLSALGD